MHNRSIARAAAYGSSSSRRVTLSLELYEYDTVEIVPTTSQTVDESNARMPCVIVEAVPSTVHTANPP
jgi:hypothetical protein